MESFGVCMLLLECLSVRDLLNEKMGIGNHTQAKLLEHLYICTWHIMGFMIL